MYIWHGVKLGAGPPRPGIQGLQNLRTGPPPSPLQKVKVGTGTHLKCKIGALGPFLKI